MENIATLEAVVTADTANFERAMSDVRSSGEGTMNFLSGLGDFGKSLTLGLTVPLVGAGIAIAKVGMDFDAEMRNINSLLQLGQDGFEKFGKEVNDFGSATVYGANATADALYLIVSAGIGIKNTADAMDLLSVSTDVAASGRDKLDRTTAAMIALHENFGKLGYDSKRLGDITAAMVQAGAGPLESYTQNLAKALPGAVNLGIGYEELASDIADLSLTYGNGSKPMTAMGMLMSNLMKPSKVLGENLNRLGFQDMQQVIEKTGGLNEALFFLKDHMDKLDFQKSFSKTGFEGVLLLTNDIDGTRKSLQEFNASINGATQRALDEQMKSTAAAFDRAKAAIEGVAVTLSRVLLPILSPIFQGVADLGNAFIHADPAMQQAVVVFGMMAAAIGPVIWAASFLIGSFSPLGLLIKGIALGAAAITANFGGMGDAFKTLASKAQTYLQPIVDLVKTLGGLIASMVPSSPIGAQGNPHQGQTQFEDGSWGAQYKDVTVKPAEEMAKFTTPKSLWQIYKDKGWDKKYSWKEFMKKAMEGGWDKAAITGTVPINIDGQSLFGEGAAQKAADQVAGIITSVFPTTLQGGFNTVGDYDYKLTSSGLLAQLKTQLSDLGIKLAAELPGMFQSLASTAGQAAGVLGGVLVSIIKSAWEWLTGGGATSAAASVGSFVQDNLITPFSDAFTKAWPDIQTDLQGLIDSITGWFDTQAGKGLDLLGKLFSGSSATGGNTPIYQAVKDLLNGDIYKAINDVIPGAGDALQKLIGGDWGARIGGAFPQISAGLASLATNFGDWFKNEAVPTVSRSIGFFIGKVGGMLLGGFRSLLSGAGDAGGGLGSAAQAFGKTVVDPLGDGIKDGFKASGQVDMDSSLKGFADRFVALFAGAIALAAAANGVWALATGGIWAGIMAAMAVPAGILATLAGYGATLVGIIGASSAWAGLTAMIAAAALPIALVGASVLAVIAAVNHFKDVTAEGVLAAKITVQQQVKMKNLTEKEVEDQVFLSIQHSPLGDIGARIFYTNFKAQIAGDVDFTAQNTTLAAPLPPVTGATLDASGTVKWTTDSKDSVLPPVDFSNTILGPDMLDTSPIVTADNFIAPTTASDIKVIGDEAVKNITDTTAQFGAAVTDQIANGTLDPATVNDNFLIPLGTYWDAAFGPAGTLTLASIAFAASFSKNMSDVSLAIGTAVTGATVQLTLLEGAFILSTGAIALTTTLMAAGTAAPIDAFKTHFVLALTSINTAILATITSVLLLITSMTALSLIPMPAGTGGGVDGSHAGGLGYVPFDGYTAELHKGEMVLTSQQAAAYRYTPAMSSNNSSRTSNSDNSNTIININGVTDADGIIKEFKRRGIKLG